MLDARQNTISLFALQGFVCDRYSNQAMHGASMLADALSRRLNVQKTSIGTIEAHENIEYTACLQKGAQQLKAAYQAISGAFATNKDKPVIVAANRCGATLATISAGFERLASDAVLLWVDAHGDYHTPETTPTGYLGGMVISAVCGLWDSGFPAPLSCDRVVLAGCRDLEDNERQALERDGVPVHWGKADGTVDVQAVVRSIAGCPVWLHVDCDVLDPAYITTEYKVSGGLTPKGLKELITAVATTSILVAVEITELDAHNDPAVQQRDLTTILDIFEPALAKLDLPVK